MEQIVISVTPNQAQAVTIALDFFSRISIGQIEELALIIRQGAVPMYGDGKSKRREVNMDTIAGIEGALAAIKGLLGYPHNGSHGIGHPHISIEGRRCYEVKKVVEKTLAEWREPDPRFHTVNYDGLGSRYTDDPAPTAKMKSA